MAVVAADELDDLVPARERAGDPECAHRRLGARAHEAHELESWHRFPDQARELELERARRAEARALAQRVLERRHHARVCVPEDERPPRKDVVHVAAAVDVDEVRALAALHEERGATDRAERTHRRADPARKEIECLCEELLRALAAHARAPATARTTDSAASSPERMQSGMPTPP